MLGETVAPLRVLIAEDETIIRMDLRGLLEKNGFMVVAEAADGAQAVELARTASPDVAILDLRMPELDGIEAARRIYAERPIPIVMLTAFSDRANIEDAIGAGVFSYLVKPFRETDIVPGGSHGRRPPHRAARRAADGGGDAGEGDLHGVAVAEREPLERQDRAARRRLS
jgi:CheY-like chemotaxis protein